jgi:hypothetical protein
MGVLSTGNSAEYLYQERQTCRLKPLAKRVVTALISNQSNRELH